MPMSYDIACYLNQKRTTIDGNFTAESKAKSECDYSDTDYSDMPDLQDVDVSDSEEE
ncbi:hypothetical protein DFH06DRAFT_1351201 [Mycena polygramma]|nr:hypothetical protein DFH06DRAFT_1351201 [Mycena polygramma]